MRKAIEIEDRRALEPDKTRGDDVCLQFGRACCLTIEDVGKIERRDALFLSLPLVTRGRDFADASPRHNRKRSRAISEINVRKLRDLMRRCINPPAIAAVSPLDVAKSPTRAYEIAIPVSNPRRTCMSSMYSLVTPSRPSGISDGCLAA